jgi:hypothetical protein
VVFRHRRGFSDSQEVVTKCVTTRRHCRNQREELHTRDFLRSHYHRGSAANRGAVEIIDLVALKMITRVDVGQMADGADVVSREALTHCQWTSGGAAQKSLDVG